ncbi:LysR family transcriptional regulator [Trichlorobacter ammonificans]|uniref:Transcriptional regulator, LysR family n=1 Tax=Trichlorobacter ammonificans TaxID=2916410 RepID=A0ABN8HNJ9_9BACT|nr:LysR family transcriptional regulator [Trichlorobacter ammonificans]CAH2032563.1 Transcriptional regulator, LysR family [Trichlorobacter ammonificans]
MDLRQLRFFLEVARAENFTRAAEKLHLAQPALSIAIRKLEEELEVALFNRRDRKITLTAEGEALARHARIIEQQVSEARQELDELRGLLRGEVRLGLSPMLSSFFFPQIVALFKRRYPALQLSINGDSARNIQRKIASGALDMGVIAGTVPEGLDSHLLVRDEVVACVHRSHPLAARKKAPLRELLAEPLIHFTEGYHLRELIEERAARDGITPAVVAESNLFSLARSLVREELGLAFFPRMVVAHDTGMAAISCDQPLFLDLAIAWKKNAALSRANREFVDFVIQEVDDYYLLAQAAGTFPLP